MTDETYFKAKALYEQLYNVGIHIHAIEENTDKDFKDGIYAHICKENIEWFADVCTRRYDELRKQIDDL